MKVKQLIILNRNDAITKLSKYKLHKLSREKRISLLLNWWCFDDYDPKFELLPESLKQEILSSDEPMRDVMDERYNPLLIEALKHTFVGVKNEYLSNQITQIQRNDITVDGEEEKLMACPCFEYENLSERDQYEICPVCFWEDDGNDDTTRYSPPNHLTLAEARENFKKVRAETKEPLRFIEPDAKSRYYKTPKSNKRSD
ncbi:CPCC family cysteine-rich protein [Desmospora activa]|uniref:Cysteine-rich CPCC n=1 Tax=Desmospora activa DSM 45169 TaxID=1121389 RepID=A0A2T4Z1W8_9BACL|nr:CPCC family cysteine-rich protein [Desmospora activa]PTM54780.1 Cysteine-rich CPCC [Desmospora activa DSM 45169]